MEINENEIKNTLMILSKEHGLSNLETVRMFMFLIKVFKKKPSLKELRFLADMFKILADLRGKQNVKT